MLLRPLAAQLGVLLGVVTGTLPLLPPALPQARCRRWAQDVLSHADPVRASLNFGPYPRIRLQMISCSTRGFFWAQVRHVVHSAHPDRRLFRTLVPNNMNERGRLHDHGPQDVGRGSREVFQNCIHRCVDGEEPCRVAFSIRISDGCGNESRRDSELRRDAQSAVQQPETEAEHTQNLSKQTISGVTFRWDVQLSGSAARRPKENFYVRDFVGCDEVGSSRDRTVGRDEKSGTCKVQHTSVVKRVPRGHREWQSSSATWADDEPVSMVRGDCVEQSEFPGV